MEQETYLSLVIISLLAFLVPLGVSSLRRVQFPAVIAEIVVGGIVGQSGFGVIVPNPQVDFLAEFGFVYLMFVSGLELDLGTIRGGLSLRAGLRKLVRSPLVAAVLIFLGTLIIAGLAAWMLVRAELVHSMVIAALILSTTSVGVVVPILKERGEIRTALGQTIMVAAVVADVVTMILLTVAIVVRREGLGVEAAVVLLVFLVAVVVFFMMELGQRRAIVRRVLRELSHAATQIKVRGALALMMVFLALSEFLGTELVLGGFLAGLLLGAFASHERGLLRAKLDAIGYGFFIPIFFINVGVRFDTATLAGTGAVWLVVGLLAAAIGAKLIPSLLLAVRFSWRDALAAGALLSARLSLVIVAADICLRAGIISASVSSAIIIVAVVVCLASPVAYSHIRPMEEGQHRKFVVVGAGRLGRELIERLVAHGHPVVVVEAMLPQRDKLLTEGRRVVVGDATARSTLERARLSPGDVLIAVTGSDNVNREVCLLARDVFKVERLVARDNEPGNTEEFRAEGIVPMNLYHSGAVVLESLATRPAVFHLVTEVAEGRDLFEVEISCPGACGTPLRELSLPGTSRLICVRRGDDTLVPTGDTVLEAGDLVTVFGTDSEREVVERLIGDVEGDDVPDDCVERGSPASSRAGAISEPSKGKNNRES